MEKVKSSKGSFQKKDEAQRKYLALRAQGIDEKTAIGIAGRNDKILWHWRKGTEGFVDRENAAIETCIVPAAMSPEQFQQNLLETSALALTRMSAILASESSTDAMKLGAGKVILEMLDKQQNTFNETRLVNKHLKDHERKNAKDDDALELLGSFDDSQDSDRSANDSPIDDATIDKE